MWQARPSGGKFKRLLVSGENARMRSINSRPKPRLAGGAEIGTPDSVQSKPSRNSVSDARSTRSEERRVGKEGRSRWAPYHKKKNRERCARDIETHHHAPHYTRSFEHQRQR